MSNYERTFKSAVWNERIFENLSNTEKVFYVLLHVGIETSDTSVFSLTHKRIKDHLMLSSVEEVDEILEKFTELGLIQYDYEHEEILVLDYFRHNPPKSPFFYEGYCKDLSKIHSKKLLEALAENAKNYTLSVAFLSALSEYVAIDPNQYKLRNSSHTLQSIKDVQARGRQKIAQKKGHIFHVTFFNKKAFDKVGGFDEKLRLINDLDMWYRLYAGDFKLHYMPEALHLTLPEGDPRKLHLPSCHSLQSDRTNQMILCF